MKTILVYFAYKYRGDWDKIYQALHNKENVSFNHVIKIENKIKQEQWQILTILDIDYPRQLKLAYKPPFVLWFKGDKNIFAQNFICLTGDQNSEKVTAKIKQFLPSICNSYTIISLLFFNLDQKILKYSYQQPYLIILSHGLNFKHNLFADQDAFLLTEYPSYVQQTKQNIMAANRLIAAFASSLIIFSFQTKNNLHDHENIMIDLINNFFNLGKDVFCFPGNDNESDGNSKLIKQGIKLITTIKDL